MPQTFREFMRTVLLESLPDLATHGAQSGFPHLTYYKDTVSLYDEHEDEIWELLEDLYGEFGYDNALELIASFGGADAVGNTEQFKNLLVWFAAEHYAYEYVAEQDELKTG